MLNRVRIAAAAFGVFAVSVVAVLAGFMPPPPRRSYLFKRIYLHAAAVPGIRTGAGVV